MIDRLRRLPRGVVLVTLLFGLLLSLWSVTVPRFRSPDEAAHVDLVLALAEDPSYPDFDGRFFGQAVGLARERHLVDLAEPWPRFAAADAVPRTERPDVADLGGTAPDGEARQYDGPYPPAGAPYVYNQMPQHPPLYHEAMGLVLRVERALVPGDRAPPLDREVGLLRLVNVLMLLPLPALAWLTARRMGADDRAALVASVLTLGLPQLAHIGASVNNDNLLTLLAAAMAPLLAGVARGRRGLRVDLALGALLGLAFLTKAFALCLVPWVVAAYAFGGLARADRRAALVGLVRVGALSAVLGGWWWVRNLVRFGEPAPTSENLTRTEVRRPEGFTPDLADWSTKFVGRMASRTWSWVGFGTPKALLPGEVVGLLLALVVVAFVVAVVMARGGDGPRRWDLLLTLVPVAVLLVFVARRAWGLHVTTGAFAFVQGRYLFCGVVPLMAAVAVGWERLARRWAPLAALAIALATQVWSLHRVLAMSWAGSTDGARIGSLLAWSPWPSPLVIAVALATLVAVVATAVATAPRS